jgi:hypothetical protein
MKKIFLFLSALVLAAFLAACNTENTHEDLHPNWEYIQDFEHMVEVLSKNFPYFRIAERRFSVNIEQVIDNTRQMLEYVEIQDSHQFRRIIEGNFISPMRQIGHLSVQDSSTMSLILGNIYRGPINYNGEYIDLGGRDFTHWGRKFIDMARSPAAQRFYGFLEPDSEGSSIIQGNISTEILDAEAGIALVSVRQFWHHNIEHDKALVNEFYKEIKDFRHLILDFRGNGGGFTRYFVQLFMAPIIPQDIEFYVYTLLRGGEKNLRWFEAEKTDARVFLDTELNKLNTAEYMAGRFELMNPADKAMLDYIVPYPVRIKSTGERLFSGEIWILVDGNSASAVEYASIYAMAADFATVVGTPTRGVTGGGLPAFFTLPNTGLVVRYDYGYFIDSKGRAIDEFGVTPDYLNQPGMNALETVLNMIKTRN